MVGGPSLRWKWNGSQWTRRGQLISPAPKPQFADPGMPDPSQIVNYSDLYQAGDTISQTLQRLTSNKYVRLPAGLYEFSDFAYSLYGIYAPFCLGLLGAGVDKTVIQIKPNSSTHVSDVPVQGSGQTNQLSLMRLSKAHQLTRDLTISGTDQPIDPNTGQPHVYNGFIHYMTTGSVLYNVKITGVPGNWNSPPGETFQISKYKDTNTLHRYVEVDGYQYLYTNTFGPDGTLNRTKGKQVGGSACGDNNSHNDTDEGCNYHDGYVSGRTYSFAGVPENASATTVGVTSRYSTFRSNANHTLAAGKKFPGLNFENVYGTILIDHPDIYLDPQILSNWDAAQIAINSKLGDNSDITIVEPEWHGQSFAKYNGCFAIKTAPTYAGATNTQVTPPTVIKNGVTLTARQVTANPPSVMAIDPTREYVWIRN